MKTLFFIERNVYDYYPKSYFKSNLRKMHLANIVVKGNVLVKDKQELKRDNKISNAQLSRMINDFDGVIFSENSSK